MGTLIEFAARRDEVHQEEAGMEAREFVRWVLDKACHLLAIEAHLPDRNVAIRSLGLELGREAIKVRAEIDRLGGGTAA